MNTDSISLHKAKHLLAHVLVAAGVRCWPQATLGESGETRTGFYADFGLPEGPGEKDLAKLTDEMVRVLRDTSAAEFRAIELPAGEAVKLFPAQPWQRHVAETLAELHDTVSLYRLGGVLDICDCALKRVEELRAIHPEHFTLTEVYPMAWEHRGQLTWFMRIRGELFPPPPPCACCPA